MHWYFALSEKSIDRERHDWRNLIRAAVQSAKVNTDLKPFMLYDGEESSFTRELQHRGVTVIFHRVSFYDSLREHSKNDENYLSISSGAFLRFDVPILETSESYVIYTDCDVLFRSNPIFFNAAHPQYFSATSQTETIPSTDMNSGVMLINVANMRACHAELVEFTRNNLHLGLDQEVLRVFFESRYTAMDMSLNWKPYWGINLAAQIVHFHGPKPSEAKTLSVDSLQSAHKSWRDLYDRNPAGYEEYDRLWLAMLECYSRESAAYDASEVESDLRQEIEHITIDRDHWRSVAEQPSASVPNQSPYLSAPPLPPRITPSKPGFMSLFKHNKQS